MPSPSTTRTSHSGRQPDTGDLSTLYMSSHIFTSILYLAGFCLTAAGLGLMQGLVLNVTENILARDMAQWIDNLFLSMITAVVLVSALTMWWLLSVLRDRSTAFSSWLTNRWGTYLFSAGHQIVVLVAMAGFFPKHIFGLGWFFLAWGLLTTAYWTMVIIKVEFFEP